MVSSTTVTTLASAPKTPPEISGLPSGSTRSRPVWMPVPETVMPRIGPWTTFQAKWKPISNHSERLQAYSTPNSRPASNPIAIAPHQVASGLPRCIIPKPSPESRIASQVPRTSSARR